MKARDIGIFVLLLIIASYLFFFNISWGAPFFFHPDERNIAYAVTALHFPNMLNPHFFAYGALPIYSIYFLTVLSHLFSPSLFSVSLADAIIISRVCSGVLALGTLVLLFLLGKKLHSVTAGLFALFLGVGSVGFIQFAHFGTFEMWLTFFYTLLCYRYVMFMEKKTVLSFFYICVITALLLSIKLSTVPFLLFPGIAVVLLGKEKSRLLSWYTVRLIVLFILTVLLVFISTNPYVFLDFTSFSSSITYESAVATGKLPVFYTGGFYHTIPVIYQYMSVYPFLLNPILTLFSICSFSLLFFKRHQLTLSIRMLLTFFLVYFFSEAFLFVKWTRYSIPTLPFIYLSISIFVLELKKYCSHTLHARVGWIMLTGLIILSTLIWSSSYFITAFIHTDTRLQAVAWMQQHIDKNSVIMTESYDLGTQPFSANFGKVQEYNFYDLDQDPLTLSVIEEASKTAEYLLLPSQRVIKNRLTNAQTFPKGNMFYKKLLTSTQFEKIYETPCDIFCRITYLNNPVFHYEETASVFDRPTIQLFQIHAKN